MSPEGTPPPAESGDAYVGSVLAGRYRILRLLGTGAMGAVYLGEHVKIGRKDAIKVLHASMERDPEAIARFTRGARNASTIRHPNVCTVYDFGETEDRRAFLAMEYVEGEQLSDLLAREGRLTPARAIAMAVQAADALQAAHDHGIVHRDLKPGNIMVGADRAGNDVVKVVDFDIAKGGAEGEEDEVTRLGFVVGTPEYMSPEQLTGDPLDGRSDLYSLGLVLFKALTGGYPFPAASTQELMVKKLTEEPLTLSEVADGTTFPAELQAFFDRCLQRKAADRFEDAAAVGRALRTLMAPGPEPATVDAPDGAGAPPVPPTRAVPTATVPPTVAVSAETTGDDRGIPRWAAVAGALAVLAGGLAVWAAATRGDVPSIEPDRRSLSLAVGESARVNARVTAGADVVEGASIQWSSSDVRVASVSAGGLVTALAPGRAVVALSFEGATDSVAVTVEEALARIALDPSELELSATVGQQGTVQRVRVTGASGGFAVTTEMPDGGGEAGWVRATVVREGDETYVEIGADGAGLEPGRYSARVVVVAERSGASARVDVSARVEPAGRDSSRDIVISAREVDAVLSRQLGHLTGSGGAPARAVSDTVGAVLAMSSLAGSQRARAYYVQASAAWELGDPCAALRLAEESVALAPGSDAYETLRTQLSELCP